MIVGGQQGPWIPFPSHSLTVYLGPKVHMLALDCRAERKLTQIVTQDTYDKCFAEVRKVKGVEQLVLLLGVPIGEPFPAAVRDEKASLRARPRVGILIFKS
jgi:hypothetical protein